MSYYQSSYYRNPQPYDAPDLDEPVPGWGLSTRMAGPAMVGVGRHPAFGFTLTEKTVDTGGEGESGKTAWWAWLAVPAVLAAAAAYALNRGWIGR